MRKSFCLMFSFLFLFSNAGYSEVTKLPEIKPGKPGIYRIVKAVAGPYQGQLVLDLGFGNYFKFGTMKSFQEGDLVFAEPVKLSKKGLATTFNFKKVLPLKTRSQVHIATDKNPIYGDESMLYTYKAYLIPGRVTDGDTFHAMIDLGFGIVIKQKIRFVSIDAPELPSEAAVKSKVALEQILNRDNGRMLITSKGFDQHGRALAHVWVQNDLIEQELLDKELAVVLKE